MAASGEPAGRDDERDGTGLFPATLGVNWFSGQCGYFVRKQHAKKNL